MNIATYNLRFGGKASARVHWLKLFEAAHPDIFLVQEMCEPRQYLSQELEASGDQICWSAAPHVS